MRIDAVARLFPFVLISLAAACGGPQPTTPSPPAPPGTTSAAPSTSASASSSATPPAKKSAPHFGYAADEGPDHWGDLDPSFSLCKTGSKQSPIALPAKTSADATAFARPSYAPIPLAILNNGHTVQVKNTAAASVTIAGVKYDLAQFHFHSPSEHTIGGKQFDLEMHLVHKSADGQTVVVGLMFTKGHENKVLKPIWDAFPTTVSETPTTIPNVSIDVAALLAGDLKFEHYDGSLTVPPCTEGVGWYVLEVPAKGGLEVSGDQVDRYRALMHGPTNRPPQPINGRTVVEIGAR